MSMPKDQQRISIAEWMGSGMSYFNEDQESYMEYLATLPPEKKCKCKWYPVGECPNCDKKPDGEKEKGNQ